MNNPGLLLILIGLLIVAAGLLWVALAHVPWLGRLPGDITIRGEHVRIYLPITTCILVSLILTAVICIIRRLY